MKKFFDYDPTTGITETFHYDPLTDETTIESTQDATPCLEVNKAMANDEEYTKQGIKNGEWHYASIPTIVQLKWLNEYGEKNWPLHPHNKDLLFRLLNSPEWRHLKTTHKMHA